MTEHPITPLPALQGKKVAIVHDFLMQYGGAERVIEALHTIFPEAPVYALAIHRPSLPQAWATWDLRPHPGLKWLSSFGALHKALFFIYPWFVEHWDFSEYDLVVSSSHAFVHGINVRSDAAHICYCYAPMRFIWMQPQKYAANISMLLRPLYRILIALLKSWDIRAGSKPKKYVSISEFTRQKIKEAYATDSEVVFPPVTLLKESSTFPSNSKAAANHFFLVVSRLVLPHKRVDLAIAAANALGFSLKIVGTGSDRAQFEKLAGKSVEFLGRVSDSELSRLYTECTGLVLSWEEEFGIAPVEANRFGKPVIAYRGGGALNTQIDHKTGIFFDELTVESLTLAFHKFNATKFDADFIKSHAQQFSEEVFCDKILAVCEKSIKTQGTRSNV